MISNYEINFYNKPDTSSNPVATYTMTSPSIIFSYNRASEFLNGATDILQSHELLFISSERSEDGKLESLCNIANNNASTPEYYMTMRQYFTDDEKQDVVLTSGYSMPIHRVVSIRFIVNNRVPNTNILSADYCVNIGFGLSTEV